MRNAALCLQAVYKRHKESAVLHTNDVDTLRLLWCRLLSRFVVIALQKTIKTGLTDAQIQDLKRANYRIKEASASTTSFFYKPRKETRWKSQKIRISGINRG